MSWRHAQEEGTHRFTVEATCEQAERWEAAAAAEGFLGAGAWLARAADAYLRELAASGGARLTWKRSTFRVLLPDRCRHPPVLREEEVAGPVSGCFGIFRETPRGLGGRPPRHSLVHLPTRRIVGTLPLQRACKALAAELSTLRIDWTVTDPERVVQGSPDQPKAAALLRFYETLSRHPPAR